MNIGLIGYGKMGKLIHELAESIGHTIVFVINSENKDAILSLDKHHVDVVIEFTNPDIALYNYKQVLSQGIPIVTGTTGWYDQMEQVKNFVDRNNGSFLYASNFSVGVNILKAVNEFLAKIMDSQNQFSVRMKEVHHTRKLDAPSGTAITLAQQIIQNTINETWHLDSNGEQIGKSIAIEAVREGDVYGDHHIVYESDIDLIEISHKAKSRKGFAKGSILAAEWLIDKQGFFSMSDLFKESLK